MNTTDLPDKRHQGAVAAARQGQSLGAGRIQHYQRGLVYYDKQTATTRRRRLHPGDHHNPDAAPFVGRGAAYMYKERPQKAIADFTEGLRLAPSRRSPSCSAASPISSPAIPTTPIADYTAAIEITPKDPLPYVNRHRALRQEEVRCRDRRFRRGAEAQSRKRSTPSSIVASPTARRTSPIAPSSISGGRISPACTANLLTVLPKNRDRKAALAEQVSHAYYQRGMALIDKQDYARAGGFQPGGRDHAGRGRDPISEARRGLSATGRQAQGRRLADFDKAIRWRPGRANVYFERGSAFHRVEDYKRAIADYTESIRLDPKEPLAYINRGMAEIFVGKVDDAIEDFDLGAAPSARRRQRADPARFRFLWPQEGFRHGLRRQQCRALEIAPDNPTALFYRAQIEALRGNSERALRGLQRQPAPVARQSAHLCGTRHGLSRARRLR